MGNRKISRQFETTFRGNRMAIDLLTSNLSFGSPFLEGQVEGKTGQTGEEN